MGLPWVIIMKSTVIGLLNIAISLFIVVLLAGIIRIAYAPDEPDTMLIMFHNEKCAYCNKFLTEVCLTEEDDEIRNTQCPGYITSTHSEKYPILIVTKDNMPDWVTTALKDGDIKLIRYTPTFVLWNGREVGRVTGYDDPDWFYEKLDKLVEKDRPQKHFYRVGEREAVPLLNLNILYEDN